MPAARSAARARGAAGLRVPLAVLGLVMGLAAWVLLHAGRRTTFFQDDWNFTLQRFRWAPYDLLHPHNEHLSAVPVFIWKVLLETVGLDDYAVFRGALVVAVLGLGLLVFAYARRRVGDWPAIALAACLMLMGPAAPDLIWAFQIGFVISMAAGVGVLLAFDRQSRRADALACALLAVALGSSSLGVPILLAAIVEVAARPDRRARWWIPAVPLVLYVAWYLRYGLPSAKASNIPEIPGWIVHAADDAAGALTGLGPTYGAFLVLLLAFFLARALAGTLRPSPRLLALVALPLSFWAATALARAGSPTSPGDPRYLLPGGLFLGLLAVELARGRVPRGRATALLTIVLAAGAVTGAHGLRGEGGRLRAEAAKAQGSLAALELAGTDRVAFDFVPSLTQGDQLLAGRYETALREYDGSPAWPLGELPGAPPTVRAEFDEALRRILQPTVVAAPGGEPDRCSPAEGQSEVEVPPEGLVVRAGDATVEVRLRRIGDAFPAAVTAEVEGGSAGLLRIEPDRLPVPWRAQLRAEGTFEVCG